jgi:hypothetical protein
MMATPQEFIAAAVEELPEAHEDLESFDGLPYIQIGCLAEIAQRAKGAGNGTKYQQVLKSGRPISTDSRRRVVECNPRQLP